MANKRKDTLLAFLEFLRTIGSRGSADRGRWRGRGAEGRAS